ncbi:hypothetical protein ACRYCC_28525 [Actinomadura scrupuli]|uniref:hypothetical protein n=1 Tax=Actinomadura scrupuli TaxID=559629 RepID=UPI003D972023
MRGPGLRAMRCPAGPGMTAVPPVTSGMLMDVPAETVYGFLSRLPNHRSMGGRRFRLESLAEDRLGAKIVIRGPLGIRRTVETTITCLHPARGVGGTAAIGRRTVAHVHWTIDAAGERSRVALTATVLRIGALDRLLLAAGGRRWLARSFHRVLTLLPGTIGAAAQHGTVPVIAPSAGQGD